MLSAIILQSALAFSSASSATLPKASDTSFAGCLPPDLQARVRASRKELNSQRTEWGSRTASERRQALDSLRTVAEERRSSALANLPPEERSRVQRRLEELDRRIGTKAPKSKAAEYRP